MEGKVIIDGTRVKELREGYNPKLSQEKLAELLGYKNKQSINQLESKSSHLVSYDVLEKLCEYFGCSEEYLLAQTPRSRVVSDLCIISREKLQQICERLGCSEDELLIGTDNPQITYSKEDLSNDKGTVKAGTELIKPFIPIDYVSACYKKIRGLSAKKICALSTILDLLQNGEDDQIDTFLEITKAVFSKSLVTKITNNREYVEKRINDQCIPEILKKARTMLQQSKYSFLDGEDWDNAEWKKRLHQNLGDFVKMSNRSLALSLERCQVECNNADISCEVSMGCSAILENSIDYLAEMISFHLMNYAEKEHICSKLQRSDRDKIRTGLPKYLTRNLKDNIKFAEVLLKEFSEKTHQ